VMALVGQMSGCASCSAPYDYCAPTFINPGCDDCMIHGRLGSILGAGGDYYWSGPDDEYYLDEPELADEESMPADEESMGADESGEEDVPRRDELVPPELNEPEESAPEEVLPEPDPPQPDFDQGTAPMGRRLRPLRLRR